MKKIVCDTNILISAFIFPGGLPEEVFKGIITQDYELGISESILKEFKRVLLKKFSWPEKKTNEIIELIQRNAIIVTPKFVLKIIHDEPDNRILECAEEFKADYIVSGDKHILDLKKNKKIKILNPSNFLKEFF